MKIINVPREVKNDKIQPKTAVYFFILANPPADLYISLRLGKIKDISCIIIEAPTNEEIPVAINVRLEKELLENISTISNTPVFAILCVKSESIKGTGTCDKKRNIAIKTIKYNILLYTSFLAFMGFAFFKNNHPYFAKLTFVISEK